MPIKIIAPNNGHQDIFLSAAKNSKALHTSWVKAPKTKKEFARYLDNADKDNHQYFLIFSNNNLAGVVNISEIVLGNFRSAYLGYYAFSPYSGKGIMYEGLRLAINYSFKDFKLHRLEANIQPENKKSIVFVKRLGFNKEGYSRRYLKVNGKWKDQERWALLKEDW